MARKGFRKVVFSLTKGSPDPPPPYFPTAYDDVGPKGSKMEIFFKGDFKGFTRELKMA